MTTAIETKYIPATNHRPSRIAVWDRTANPSRMYVSYDHSDNPHETAVKVWVKEIGYGYMPKVVAATDRGYIFA